MIRFEVLVDHPQQNIRRINQEAAELQQGEDYLALFNPSNGATREQSARDYKVNLYGHLQVCYSFGGGPLSKAVHL